MLCATPSFPQNFHIIGCLAHSVSYSSILGLLMLAEPCDNSVNRNLSSQMRKVIKKEMTLISSLKIQLETRVATVPAESLKHYHF